MSDTFNIGTVEQFSNLLPLSELSDISKIIKEMIIIKNDINRVKTKRTLPYDITDKMRLNRITSNMSLKIKKYHLDYYDVVDDALNCIEEYEPSIKSDMYDYYWEVYLTVITDLGIDYEDKEKILDNSEIIFQKIIECIDTQLFIGRQSGIETNKKITYLNAITSYVFYECKILIPVQDFNSILE